MMPYSANFINVKILAINYPPEAEEEIDPRSKILADPACSLMARGT